MKRVPSRGRVASLAVLALLASGAAAGPAAKPRMEIAVCEGSFTDDPQGSPRRNFAFDRATELGATWIRATLPWVHGKDSQGNPITYDDHYVYFPPFDSFVNEAIGRGFEVELTLSGLADAGYGGPSRTGVNPDPVEYGRYVAAVARHFKGRVHRFSIWNEPNLPVFLQCAPRVVFDQIAGLKQRIADPHTPAAVKRVAKKQLARLSNAFGPRNAARYRELYRAGRRALLAAIPDAEVLFGELSSSHEPFAFMNLACPPGEHAVAEGLALHPYQFAVAPDAKVKGGAGAGISRVADVQQLLATLAKAKRLTTRGGGKVPLYLTEFGYQKLEGRTFKSPATQIPESRRAAWLPVAFDEAARHGARQMLYFQLLPTPPSYPWDTSVLDGNGNPLASFAALERWAKIHGY